MTMNVLFLCTGNSCRSQMAEGIARHVAFPDVAFYSAGIIAKGLDPLAIETMLEVDINIANQRSKTLGELGDIRFDLVVTLCGNAHETCPVFPHNTPIIHRGFDDPPSLANNAHSKEEKLGHYRTVRDHIYLFLTSQEFGTHISRKEMTS